MDIRTSGLKRAAEFLPRLTRIAIEDVEPFLSRRLLATVASGFPQQSFSRMRTAMLRAAGMRIGQGSLLQGPLRVTGSGNPCTEVSIGTFTLASGSLHLDVGASIRIGDRVRIGHDVCLLTVDHAVGTDELRCGPRKGGPIEIGDGAWLASRVVVLPGIKIGAGAVVAAGSVVTHDVPANTVVAGSPARTIRMLRPDGQPDEDFCVLDAPVSSRRFNRNWSTPNAGNL